MIATKAASPFFLSQMLPFHKTGY